MSTEDKVKELEEQLKKLQDQWDREKQEGQTGPKENLEVVKVVYPPRDRKVAKFGKNDELYLVEDFLQEVESIMSASGRGSVEQADFIIGNLEGSARDEIKCLTLKEQRDPEMIKQVLREVFGEHSSVSHLTSLLYARKQEAGESLQQYSLALLLLAHRVETQKGSAEAILGDIFAENVSDVGLRRELKRQLRQTSGTPFRELRSLALKWEQDGQSTISTGRQRAKVNLQEAGVCVQEGGSQDLVATLAKQQKVLEDLAASVQGLLKAGGRVKGKRNQRGEGQLICYGCNKPGHIKPNCPNKVKPASGEANDPSTAPNTGSSSTPGQAKESEN